MNDIKEEAEAARLKLIPAKSSERYEKEMKIFKEWSKNKYISEVDENVILAYVSELVSFIQQLNI
jgi:hypothetical protein